MAALADLLALVHGLVVIPTIAAAPWVFIFGRRRRIWLERLYLLVGGATAVSFLLTGECMLSVWENQIRARAAPGTAYTGGFISHYAGWAGIPWRDKLTLPLAVSLIVLGVAALLRRWWAGHRARHAA
ncbi:MAG: DUF2784 family protein [Armatimonadetes bacterium]|nr:DUF2784 family protein [Armatimonadota bacterium]